VPYPLTQPRLRDWLIFFSAIYILPFFLVIFYYPYEGDPAKKSIFIWDFFAYLSVALSDRGKSTTP
jgi:hypothetical protein